MPPSFGEYVHELEAEGEKILDKVENIFTGAKQELKTVILPIAIKAANVLKTVTEYDKADVIGSLFGNTGKVVEDDVRNVVPGVIVKMQLAQQFLTLTDPNAIILEVKQLLESTLTPQDVKDKFYIEFAGQVAQDIAANKKITLTIGQAIVLGQMVYNYETGEVDATLISANAVVLEGKAAAEAAPKTDTTDQSATN